MSQKRISKSKKPTKKKLTSTPKITIKGKIGDEDDEDGTWLCRWCGEKPATAKYSTKSFALCSEKCKKEYLTHKKNIKVVF